VKALLKRILLFLVGIPLLYAAVVFLPYYNHIGFNLLAILFSLIGAFELEYMFGIRGLPFFKGIAPLSGFLLPLAAYADSLRLFPIPVTELVLILLVSFTLGREVFARSEADFPSILSRMGQSALSILYPGYLISFAVKLTSLAHAEATIFVFLVLIFSNDTLAYIAGMLFGKGSRGICPVSPKKSASGFIGGFIGSLAASAAAFLLVPEVFGGSAVCAGAAGIAAGFSAIVGDLIESAMKRSAGIKDSGSIMLGRGGVLDSIDSILYSAPLFYYIISLGR
jgi:phosphatidate cytidylyltransferase